MFCLGEKKTHMAMEKSSYFVGLVPTYLQNAAYVFSSSLNCLPLQPARAGGGYGKNGPFLLRPTNYTSTVHLTSISALRVREVSSLCVPLVHAQLHASLVLFRGYCFLWCQEISRQQKTPELSFRRCGCRCKTKSRFYHRVKKCQIKY